METRRYSPISCFPVLLFYFVNMSVTEERVAPKRRNAVRKRQIVEIKGHKFVLNYFKTFTFCGHCSRFLWYAPPHVRVYLSSIPAGACRGLKVTNVLVSCPLVLRATANTSHFGFVGCDFATHRRCLEYVPFTCPGTNLPEGIVSVLRFK